MKYILSLLGLLAFASSVLCEGYGKLEVFLPTTGEVVADVMVLSAPVHIENIGLKIQASMQRNPEWTKSYVAQAEPGQPLIYHKNMGVSEEEYSLFLAGANSLELVKKGETKLTFAININGEVVIQGLPGPGAYSKLSYSPTEDAMLTTFGSLEEKTNINQRDKASPLGAWSGKQWKFEKFVSEGEYKSIRIAFGKLIGEEKGLIYYNAKITVEGRPQELSYVLLYVIK